MTTSLSNHIAHVTQSTYSAANNFQDAFARYRHSLGLPACAIALGLITEISDIGQQAFARNSMSRLGLYETGEYEFLSVFEAAFFAGAGTKPSSRNKFDSPSQPNIITSLEPSKLLEKQRESQYQHTDHGTGTAPRWHRDARFSHVRCTMLNLTACDGEASAGLGLQSRTDTSALQVDQLIQLQKLNEALSLATTAIITRVADMLFTSADGIEADKSVSDYGVDSLIAAELRNWFASTYACEVSFLKMLDANTTISDLGKTVIESREKRFQGAENNL